MIELKRHIEILLLGNDCVIVPDFGGFMAHHVEAVYDGSGNMFLPPLRTIGFNPQLKVNDSLLVLSYVEAYDISYPEALNRIAEEVAEVRQTLDNEGKYVFSDLGTIRLNEDGNYSFEPCEAGILTPSLYGLGSFDMLPLAQLNAVENGNQEAEVSETIKQAAPETGKGEGKPNSVFVPDEEEDEDRHPGAEVISIKKSWLRNIAAACIAVIAFFTVSTPLGTPNVQKSQIDTGMLTRIMPKELTTTQEAKPVCEEPQELNLTQEESAEESETNKKLDIAQDQELPTSTSYYSIVLASRVTKRNAAHYAEMLQNKGFKEAKVLITSNNVKVIYGTYPTQSEAYSALNRLHDNEAFSDAWITQVKE